MTCCSLPHAVNAPLPSSLHPTQAPPHLALRRTQTVCAPSNQAFNAAVYSGKVTRDQLQAGTGPSRLGRPHWQPKQAFFPCIEAALSTLSQLAHPGGPPPPSQTHTPPPPHPTPPPRFLPKVIVHEPVQCTLRPPRLQDPVFLRGLIMASIVPARANLSQVTGRATWLHCLRLAHQPTCQQTAGAAHMPAAFAAHRLTCALRCTACTQMIALGNVTALDGQDLLVRTQSGGGARAGPAQHCGEAAKPGTAPSIWPDALSSRQEADCIAACCALLAMHGKEKTAAQGHVLASCACRTATYCIRPTPFPAFCHAPSATRARCLVQARPWWATPG